MRPSTRKTFITLALLASTGMATSAAADFSDFTESMGDYFSRTGGHFLTGFNGLVTSPADPVMSVVTPPEEYAKLPAGAVTGRFFGMIQGSLMMAYRSSMGLLDMVLSPIPIVILSPEPRYQPIPGFEWEG